MLAPKVEIHHRYFVDKNFQKQPTVSALAFTFTLLHLQHQVFKKVKVPSYMYISKTINTDIGIVQKHQVILALTFRLLTMAIFGDFLSKK